VQQVRIIQHGHSVGAEHRGCIEPVNGGKRKAVATVDKHEIEILQREVREYSLRGADVEGDSVCRYPA
jgi:plasmid stability protein